MIRRSTLTVCVLMWPLVCATGEIRAQPAIEATNYWHQWRGPEANGVSRTARPPIEWSEEENIKWKVALDGNGSSTPIIWGNQVFLLTAINTGQVDPSLPKPEDQPERVFGIKYPNTVYRFVVLCLDRETGEELWRNTATERIPHQGHHGDNDFASASPTTDGHQLYCWFGSQGLFCYDLQGNKLWERDLGKAYVESSLGEGCSPVVHGERLVIVRDNARQSNIEVLDTKTGQTLWKKDRDEPSAWATPRVVQYGGKTQVITAASNMVRSYDLEDGEIIWECNGLTGNVIPCPVVDGDVVYCMSGYQGYSLLALSLSARGDITGSDKIVWSKRRGTPYIPSPLLYDGMLYFNQSNQAILTCLDSKTGDTIMARTRLPAISNIYASPVAADGRIYIAGRNGTTLVLARSGSLKVLATNKLDDPVDSSPALAGDQLFLRGSRYLYCIEQAGDRLSSKLSSNERPSTPAQKPGRGITQDRGGKILELRLTNAQVRDAGLEHLRELTSLTRLDLGGTPATDADVVHLKGLINLKVLHLEDTQVSDAGLEHLQQLTSLSELSLGGTRITDAGLVHLKGLTGLTDLYLDRTQVSDGGLVHLKWLTRLTDLYLDHTQVRDAGLAHLKEFKSLKTLNLEGTQISNVGTRHLKRLTRLKVLSLWGTQVRDDGLVHLKTLTSLEELWIRDTHVSDAGLEHLKSLTGLKYLDLVASRISDSGVAEFKKAVPDCYIVR